MRPGRTRSRGIAIVTVMLVLSIMAVIALGITALGSDNLVRLRGEQKGLLAQYAAEAGLWRGVLYVADGGAAGMGVFTDEAMDNVDAEYTVDVYQGPDVRNGINVPDANHYYVESRGETTNDFSPTQRRMGVLLRTAAAGGLDVPVFAKDSLQITGGSYTDTWDSRIGPYTDPDGAGPIIPSKDADVGRAHVGTNSGAPGAVDLGDTGIVGNGVPGSAQANVYVGPGGSAVPGTTVVNAATPTNFADIIVMSNLKALDLETSPDLPTFGTGEPIEVGGTVVLAPGFYYPKIELKAGAVLTLLKGEYRIAELKLEDGVTVVVEEDPLLGGIDPAIPDDRVEVYIENIDPSPGAPNLFKMEPGTGSAIINPTGNPDRLRFYGGTNSSFDFKEAGSEAYLVCYAPDSPVLIQAANLYGAVVGETIDLTDGAAVHYDLALEDVDLSGGGGGGVGVDIVLFQRF